MSVSPEDVSEGRINDQLGTQLESISAQVEANVERGRNALAEWRTNFSEQLSDTFSSLDEYARHSPWPLVCGAVVLGLVAGALCGRK